MNTCLTNFLSKKGSLLAFRKSLSLYLTLATAATPVCDPILDAAGVAQVLVNIKYERNFKLLPCVHT